MPLGADGARLRAEAPGLLAAHAAGVLGALIAMGIGAPLPWLLGGLFGSAALVSALPRGLGAPWRPQQTLRNVFVVVIGVMIGGAFTPELLSSLPGWGPSLLGLLIFTVAAQLLVYAAYRRAGMDPATAWFGASPGGLLENIVLGEQAGGNVQRITLLQFGRIAAAVTLVPILYSLWTGTAVGSAAGERFGAGAPLGVLDALILVASGVVGYAGARRLRIPAGVIVGPVLVSAAVHGLGLTHGQVPQWLVALAQLVVGVGLGLRFGGLAPGDMGRALGLSAASVLAMLALALAIALAAAPWSLEGPAALVLSYAPGGIIEMGLIALSLGANPVFVTAHHVARVLLSVTLLPWIFRRLFAP
ncbi:MAG TPA: AbrB family transcriptional regulator [Paracoccaceae bacterium]|nr:AbrB family transcriptional regulator [Paracoccaceae bacterium]